MSGTITGGKLAGETNKKKYGADFYIKMGAKGGAAGRGHAFAHGKVTAQDAGRIGGRISRKSGPHKSKNKAIIVKDEDSIMTAEELHGLFGVMEPELTRPSLINRIRRIFNG